MVRAEIRVEVFTAPGCARCAAARERLRAAAEQAGGGRVRWREVDVTQEAGYAISLGVLSTPAIALDGELVFATLPSEAQLRAAIARRLAAARR
ncbi:MAG: thioredoxin family protein [Pseudomonadota bacterium]